MDRRYLSKYKYVYRVNRDDIVVFVDEDWLSFARENDAADLTAERVIGSSLWDHIEGTVTRELYQELFAYLRREQAMTIVPYRCDSPTVHRSLDLAIEAMPDGSIQFSTHVLAVERSEYQPLLDASGRRSRQRFGLCSLCKAARLPSGEWTSLDHVLMRINLDQGILPEIENGVCPACNRSVRELIHT